MDIIMNIDSGILLYIQEFIRTPFLDSILKFITHLGDKGFIWIMISLLLILNKKTRKVGIMSIAALMFMLIINNCILKNIVMRRRPFYDIEGLITIIKEPNGFSFPSGHASGSFASSIVIFRNMTGKLGVPAIVMAVLISISRMYVGVHYPTDVIFGALSGILCGLLSEALVKRIDK